MKLEWLAEKGSLLVAWFLFFVFVLLTWARWGDVNVDCGREVLTASLVSQGRVPYKDFFYLYGPLAVYSNAFILKLFGTKLSVFYGIGTVLSFFILTLNFKILERITNSLTALLVTCLLMSTLVFNSGLFSYLFPYSYASIIGILLLLIQLWFAMRGIDTENTSRLLLMGLPIGLQLINKHEYAFAAVMLAVVACLFFQQLFGKSLLWLFKQLALVFLMSSIVPTLVWGYFLLVHVSLRDLLSNIWPSSMIKMNSFIHKAAIGSDYSIRSLMIQIYKTVVLLNSDLLLAFGGMSILTVLFIRSASEYKQSKKKFYFYLTLLLIATVYDLFFLNRFLRFRFYQILDFVSVFNLCAVVWAAVCYVKRKLQNRWVICLVAICGALIQIRSFSNTSIYNYGLYYAFFSFSLALALFIYYAASFLGRYVFSELVWKIAVLAFTLLLFAVGCSRNLDYFYGRKLYKLQTDKGTIYTDASRGAAFQDVLSFLRARDHQNRFIHFFPEECILYTLSNNYPASKYIQPVYSLLRQENEAEVINSLKRKDVEFIFVSNRSMHEFFPYPSANDYFGRCYGQSLFRWINENYAPDQIIGRVAFDERYHGTQDNDENYGFIVFKRKELNNASGSNVLTP